MANRWGSNVNSERLYFGGLQNHCQETGVKTIPKKKKCKKAKWLSEEALQIAVKKKRSEKQRRKGKIYPFECIAPKNSKER